MYLNLVEVDACCLKQEMPGKHYAVPKNCFVLLCNHAFILLIDRDFVVTRTNYYDITKARQPEGRLARVGDLLRCNNALSAEGGCGTHELCGSCPIRKKIEETFRTKSSFTDLEAILDIRDRRGEVAECDTYVSGEYMEIDDKEGMVITVQYYPTEESGSGIEQSP